MQKNIYLSIDIGASSGRHIISYLEHDKIIQKEIYRFKNEMITINDQLFWDFDALFTHVLEGLKICKAQDMIPKSVGIDTWAVDYVLLDENKNLLNLPYAYRDTRTEKIIPEIHKIMSNEVLYEKTGIQYQAFNTVYQLKSETEENRNKAKHFLMIPDYLNYKLSGVMKNEYTNFSTTQLLNIKTSEIDSDILACTGFKKDIFKEMVNPGMILGNFTEDIKDIVGFDAEVMVIASHDTASAFVARKVEDSFILSSGTWSLLGIACKTYLNNEASLNANITNEGGYNQEYRILKNIMGLWIIQEVARNINYEYAYEELANLAKKSSYDFIFDVNDIRFSRPENMIEEIQNYFREKDQQVPLDISDIARTVYRSLAYSYKEAILKIENLTGKTYKAINILGGGSKNNFLNDELEKLTHKKIILGPTEATALGNAAVQMVQYGEIQDIQTFRKLLND